MKAGTRSGKIIELPWWRHPDKGRDAEYQPSTPSVGSAAGQARGTSCRRGRRTKRNLAQNVDMEHGKVGDSIFDADDIEAHRKKFEAEPNAIGAVAFDDGTDRGKKLATVRTLNPFAMRWVQGAARRRGGCGWNCWSGPTTRAGSWCGRTSRRGTSSAWTSATGAVRATRSSP
jgi:hypothetical protein